MRLRRADPHTLAGAYALDALTGADRALFERHLGGCEACRAEAASLRDAAGQLAAATAAAPPPSLRGQVLAEAARTRQQPPPLVRERAPRSWLGMAWPAPRLAVAIAGACMLVALALGTLVISTQHKLHVEEAHSGQIAAVLNAPDATMMTARARPRGSATVVMSHTDRALVLTTAQLPALPSTECYQVWLMGPQRTWSPGKLPTSRQGVTAPMIVHGLAAGDWMGLTVEPASGASQPSSRMVLMLDLTG
jgi:Anti-sigma-K factor rskA/Putative zinc-finger